jgi:putative hemolysin
VFELMIVLVLVLVNGLFSGAEIALLSVRKTRVQELVLEGRTGARWVADLRAHPERLLATVQIGITVVGSTAAAFGGSSIADRVAEGLRPALGPNADDVALGLVVAFVSYLSLVLGELVPKSLALRAAEPYALLVAAPLAALAFVGRPLV